MATSTFDALIVGGGPGGATAALLLARAGWSVALLEKTRFPRQKVCGEFLSATNLPLLRHLGLAESFLELAGPAVRQVALFSRDRTVVSDMPRYRALNPPRGGGNEPHDPVNEEPADEVKDAFGRALGRDRLDTLLLHRAAAAGAVVYQPWSAVALAKDGEAYLCTAVCRDARQSREFRARIVIAAHGSWEPGPLPTQRARPASLPSDLLGFKAHFLDARLSPGLMPLLAFPGGYGGMVHSDHGRVSLSCCIRRDRLEAARRAAGSATAAQAVLAHITRFCRPAREALATAKLEHDWLSAGPIRPGIRSCGFDNIFLVGNAAGEAHPVVAEGIGMAMQSAWLLCQYLAAEPAPALSERRITAVRNNYTAAWRRALAPRIRAAALIAHWTMSPAAVAGSLPLLRLFPGVLTAGARFSGKAASANIPLLPLPSAPS